MKIFGIDLNFSSSTFSSKKVKDQEGGRSIEIKKIKQVKTPVLAYRSSFSQRGSFEPPEYNLSEIGRVEDVESYVRQAFRKKCGLMFKEGWELIGPNQKTLKYVQDRFSQIEAASGGPIRLLMRETAMNLIKYSNAYWVKVRDQRASGGGARVLPGQQRRITPVAAYFQIAPEMIEIKRNEYGKVLKYRQRTPDGKYVDFNPIDIIHFYFDRKTGFSTGTPFVVPVLDDIRALRRIEENIELLVYQNLFPLFHYQVGTEEAPAEIYPNGTNEVDVVKQEIQFMPSEGGIVTPERHNIKLIGSEGRALRAEGYLTHFKKRVFSGLGLSAVDFGEGECYDACTHTLTENGWKLHTQIDHKKERIATYNPETQATEFNYANHKYEGLYKGDMITFKGKHLDIKVTPHHEMWIAPRQSDNKLNWQKVYAEELLNDKYSEFYMMESAPIKNKEIKDTVIEIIPNAKKSGRAKSIKCDIIDYAKFLGYYISEGCVDECNAREGRYRTVISQNRGPGLDEICALADHMKLSFSMINRNNRPEESGIKIYSLALYQHLKKHVPGNCYTKRIPNKVWSWSFDARKALLEGLILGDGTIAKREGRTSKIYYTCNSNLADDVQMLAISLGLKAKITGNKQDKAAYGEYIYRVLISGTLGELSKRIVSKDMISRESYEGTIYCYNVPNHLFITRRNGKVTIQGNTANRSTADSMSRSLVDDVKSMQREFETFVNEFIIKELLLESTFEKSLNKENLVVLKFHEVDLDAKIKVENHMMTLYQGYLTTEDETRRSMGLEPLTEEQRANTFWELVKKPQAIIQSLDEKFIQEEAVASPGIASTEAEQSRANKSRMAEEERLARIKKAVGKKGPASTKSSGAEKKAKSKNQPSNQHGTNQGPTKRKSSLEVRDNIIKIYYNMLKSDTISAVKQNKYDEIWFKATSLAAAAKAQEKFERELRQEFRKGVREAKVDIYMVNFDFANEILRDRAYVYISKIITRLSVLLQTRIGSDKLTQKEMINKISATFDAVEFRTKTVYRSELHKAHMFGLALGLKAAGYESATTDPTIDACEECKQHKDLIIDLNYVTIEQVPGLHPNCDCGLKPIKKTELNIDSLQDLTAKEKRCVLKVIKQLRKKFPNRSEKDIRVSAIKICRASINKDESETDKIVENFIEEDFDEQTNSSFI